MAESLQTGVYGDPPRPLAPSTVGLQFSPFANDGARLEDAADGSAAELTVLAPAGTLERRYVLAQSLRILRPGGRLVAMALKTRGGARLGAELTAFGCEVSERAKAHHRICHCERPEVLLGTESAIAAGSPQVPPDLGIWSQPGLFSWDRIDPGSALLIRSLGPLSGSGADVGCGYGALSQAVLENASVRALLLVDSDRRAVDMARRNVVDPRASFLHADARDALAQIEGLDFVVINPPFHSSGREDRNLGPELVAAAGKALRRGGICRLVANVALPYEAAMAADFSTVRQIARENGFKVLEGRR